MGLATAPVGAAASYAAAALSTATTTSECVPKILQMNADATSSTTAFFGAIKEEVGV